MHHKQPKLLGRQVRDPHDRHLLKLQKLGCSKTGMTCDETEMFIDDQGRQESGAVDASRQLADLNLAMPTRLQTENSKNPDRRRQPYIKSPDGLLPCPNSPRRVLADQPVWHWYD